MGTKTISIMDDVYDKLIALKTPGESFSEQLRKLTSAKSELMNLAGSWKITEKEANKIKKEIKGSEDTRIKEIITRFKE